jgi:hypothetical protein
VISSTVDGLEDFIAIGACGVSTASWDDVSPTLADYEAAGSLGFAVVGMAPSTDYTVEVLCGTPNPVRPTDCGGSATDSASLGINLANPNVAHIYEIPLASVQTAASSIRMEIDTGFSWAILVLADRDVTPGSPCFSGYVMGSFSGSGTEWIEIDGSGITSGDGSSTGLRTLADYQGASTNLSFAILGLDLFGGTVTYDLTVTCN